MSMCCGPEPSSLPSLPLLLLPLLLLLLWLRCARASVSSAARPSRTAGEKSERRCSGDVISCASTPPIPRAPRSPGDRMPSESPNSPRCGDMPAMPWKAAPKGDKMSTFGDARRRNGDCTIPMMPSLLSAAAAAAAAAVVLARLRGTGRTNAAPPWRPRVPSAAAADDDDDDDGAADGVSANPSTPGLAAVSGWRRWTIWREENSAAP